MNKNNPRGGRAARSCRLHARSTATFGILMALLQGPLSGQAFCQSITPAAPTLSTTPEKATPAAAASDIGAPAPLSASSAPQGNSSNVPAPADASRAIGDHRSLDEAVRGVVIDEVITLVGQDFYNSFVSAWRDVPLSDRYNISIYERPSARWGSLVWVEFEHRRLFEAFLPPTRTGIKAIGERAANATYQQLVQADLDRLLFKDQDFAPDEM